VVRDNDHITPRGFGSRKLALQPSPLLWVNETLCAATALSGIESQDPHFIDRIEDVVGPPLIDVSLGEAVSDRKAWGLKISLHHRTKVKMMTGLIVRYRSRRSVR
jgi:hypothetical protein